MNTSKYNLSDWDSERYVDQLISENDDTFIPCPTIDLEPDLLLSKVRQHYMRHMVKLLSVNYETNQKLLNKNIYLPSGIWRCAKVIEMKAAQQSMVIERYRTHILAVIKDVKRDTEKGKLYRNLLESIRTPPNDKKIQTSTRTDSECYCKCHSNDNKRRRKSSPQCGEDFSSLLQGNRTASALLAQFKIPVAINMQTHTPEPVSYNRDNYKIQELESKTVYNTVIATNQTEVTSEYMITQQTAPINSTMTPMPDNDSDDVMLQLEKLFHTDQTDDDLFDSTFNIDDKNKGQNIEETMSKIHERMTEEPLQPLKINNLVIENHSAQIRSLDERLATLTDILINNNESVSEKKEERKSKSAQKEKEVKKKKIISKWHCEEYFLKKELLDTLYQIGDTNRTKLVRIKSLFTKLFGEDDLGEGSILSPIEESPYLVASCKTRISMWVLTTLTPYYSIGRIRGKNLFKSVVKYLIELIFKCKQYPDESEVTTFVQDFIQNRAIITCEADFRDLIDNVR